MSATPDHIARLEDEPGRLVRQGLHARRAAQQERDDLIWLMNSRRGRRIVWRMLDRGGPFRSVFSTNALTMANAEGRREASIDLLSRVQTAAFDQYVLMVRENTEADVIEEELQDSER